MVPTIDIDFDVYKALTVKRTTEDVTYNNVIRDLLRLGPQPKRKTEEATGGVVLKGVSFPDGTQFRATYKGRTYAAEIRGGEWMDSDGTPRNSPSEAAHAITHTQTNGWRFWEAKRPGDPSWRVLADLR